jgi:hypothetical protein
MHGNFTKHCNLASLDIHGVNIAASIEGSKNKFSPQLRVSFDFSLPEAMHRLGFVIRLNNCAPLRDKFSKLESHLAGCARNDYD